MIITTVRTTLGEQISAYAAASNLPVTFTGYAVGDGLNPGTLKDRTALVSSWKTFPVSSVEKTPDDKVRVRGAFDNSAQTTDKNIREVGLFASAGTMSGLYAYGHAVSGSLNYTEVMPKLSVGGFTRRVIDLVVDVASAAAATFTVLEEAAAPEDFDELVAEVGNVATITNLADGVTYPKTIAGVVQKIHDLLSSVLALFTGAVMNIANGGTGATTAADARASLEITPENIGASPANHTHEWPEATQEAAGLMSADDKAKLDAMTGEEWLRTVVTSIIYLSSSVMSFCSYNGELYSLKVHAGLSFVNKTDGALQGSILTDTGSAKCICCDGVNIYAPLFQLSLILVYNLASQTYSIYSLPGTGTYACCTDGVRVYCRSSSKLYVFTIASGATSQANVTAYSGADSRGICTDGIDVYMASGLNIDRYNILNATVSNIYNGDDLCIDCCNGGDVVFFATQAKLKIYSKSTGLLSEKDLSITAPYSAVRRDGDYVYVFTTNTAENVKFLTRVHISTLEEKVIYSSREIVAGSVFEVVGGKVYLLDKIDTRLYEREIKTGRLFSSNGLKMVTFSARSCFWDTSLGEPWRGSDAVNFPECFNDAALYASIVSPGVGESIPVLMSAASAKFPVQTNTDYSGFAIGL
jgi:hypothetical protein